MKFRPHAGGLAESMAQVVELTGFRQLVDYLRANMTYVAVAPDKVTVHPYCYDDRTGWKTYMVTIDGKAVGFTDGPCTDNEQ